MRKFSDPGCVALRTHTIGSWAYAEFMSWASDEGSPLPRGVSCVAAERAYNFALYSKHAERVTLAAFRPDDCATPALTRTLDHLHHKSGRVWHCRLTEAELSGAQYYAYMVDGPPPAGQFAWHAFRPEKILLDTYAGATVFPPGFAPRAAKGRESNAGRAPLGVLPSHDESLTHAPQAGNAIDHEEDAIIYELHVQNITC